MPSSKPAWHVRLSEQKAKMNGYLDQWQDACQTSERPYANPQVLQLIH